MLDKYIVKNGKKLRCGYTTGSCAAAASKAAVTMLFSNKLPDTVAIDTPMGWQLELSVDDINISPDNVICSVRKDAGDDPDATDGVRIYAKAAKTNIPGIEVTAGKGIGVVTRKGLSVERGKPAINRVPMEMILSEVKKVLPENAGVAIEISAPEGIAIAEKTFNPKLGIIGGISILGTTGIVKPMSEDSMRESLALRIPVLKEDGVDTLVFVPGNYGEKFAINNLSLPAEKIVVTGNYLGYMLEQALYYKIKKIMLTGHIGKLAKAAGGIFNTHSRFADARLEILASHYGLYTGEFKNHKDIMNCATTEEALEYIEDASFYKYLAERISGRCRDFVHQKISIETAVFSMHKGLLGMSSNAGSLIAELAGNA